MKDERDNEDLLQEDAFVNAYRASVAECFCVLHELVRQKFEALNAQLYQEGI